MCRAFSRCSLRIVWKSSVPCRGKEEKEATMGTFGSKMEEDTPMQENPDKKQEAAIQKGVRAENGAEQSNKTNSGEGPKLVSAIDNCAAKPQREMLPEAGSDAALGTAFSTGGRHNDEQMDMTQDGQKAVGKMDPRQMPYAESHGTRTQMEGNQSD